MPNCDPKTTKAASTAALIVNEDLVPGRADVFDVFDCIMETTNHAIIEKPNFSAVTFDRTRRAPVLGQSCSALVGLKEYDGLLYLLAQVKTERRLNAPSIFLWQ